MSEINELTVEPESISNPNGLVVTLDVEHQYWVATQKGQKMFEVRKMSAKLLSCKYLILRSLKTKEVMTFEVGYRLPLKELNTWWADIFQGKAADVMVMGLNPSDKTFLAEVEL